MQGHGVRMDRDVHVAPSGFGGDHDPPGVERDLVSVGAPAQQVDADEVGDVPRPRSSRDLGDRPDLRDPAVLEHDEAIGERDRVEQLVGHEDRAPGERREVRAQIAPQLGAGADVERGERLVEQQQARLGRQRARERDPLRCPPES